jgi:hypothetical protein
MQCVAACGFLLLPLEVRPISIESESFQPRHDSTKRESGSISQQASLPMHVVRPKWATSGTMSV